MGRIRRPLCERVCRASATALTVLIVGGCSEGPVDVRDVESAERSVEVLGAPRAYRLFVPEGLDRSAPHPLVFVFHGATQGASAAELMSWFYPVAEEQGLVVAFPQAAGDYWNTPASPSSYWGIPDVPFVDAMIADIAGQVAIDSERVFAAGFSNGAVFAQVVGCLRSDAIAGIAIVGAGISAEVANGCPWERPMPVVVFLGDRDPQFFWDDGVAAGVGMLGGVGSANWLAEQNGCPEVPEGVDLGSEEGALATSVELFRYEACTEAPVDFYRIRGGGHTWPGSPLNFSAGLGRKTGVVSATDAMTAFFLTHTGGTP